MNMDTSADRFFRAAASVPATDGSLYPVYKDVLLDDNFALATRARLLRMVMERSSQGSVPYETIVPLMLDKVRSTDLSSALELPVSDTLTLKRYLTDPEPFVDWVDELMEGYMGDPSFLDILPGWVNVGMNTSSSLMVRLLSNTFRPIIATKDDARFETAYSIFNYAVDPQGVRAVINAGEPTWIEEKLYGYARKMYDLQHPDDGFIRAFLNKTIPHGSHLLNVSPHPRVLERLDLEPSATGSLDNEKYYVALSLILQDCVQDPENNQDLMEVLEYHLPTRYSRIAARGIVALHTAPQGCTVSERLTTSPGEQLEHFWAGIVLSPVAEGRYYEWITASLENPELSFDTVNTMRFGVVRKVLGNPEDTVAWLSKVKQLLNRGASPMQLYTLLHTVKDDVLKLVTRELENQYGFNSDDVWDWLVVLENGFD